MADPITLVITAISVASAVYSYTVAKSIDTPDSSDIGVNVTKSGSQSTRNIIYGRSRTSSVNVYNNVNDTDNAQMVQVFTMGIGPLTTIHNLYIDEVPVFSSDQSIVSDPNDETSEFYLKNLLSNGFEKQVDLQFRNGHESEVYMKAIGDRSDGEWTPDHRGDRCSQVGIIVKRIIDQDGIRITSDRYSVSGDVSGLALHDPRYHINRSDKAFQHNIAGSPPTNPAVVPVESQVPGRNPALALFDYLTDTYYGMAIPDQYVNFDDVMLAADFCDLNDLFIDGEINTENSHSDIITKILSCFGGFLVNENGQLRIKFEQKETNSLWSFDYNNILSDINVTNQSSSNYWNVVETKFKSAAMNQKEDNFVLPQDVFTDPRVQRDGVVETKTLDMPLTIDGNNSDIDGNILIDGAVKFLTNREYERSNYQKTIEFEIDYSDYPVETTDIIDITDENLGWVSKKFRVQSYERTIDSDKLDIATVRAIEYADEIYDANEEGTVGSKPKPRPPVAVAPVAGLVFNQETYITNGYGTLSWNQTAYDPSLSFIVEYKLSSVADWTRLGETLNSFWKVQNLKTGDYDFRVAQRHGIYGTSGWTTIVNQSINQNYTLPNVTGVTCDTTTIDFDFTWDDMLNESTGVVVDPDNPDGLGIVGVVSDVFADYVVDIYHNNLKVWDQYL